MIESGIYSGFEKVQESTYFGLVKSGVVLPFGKILGSDLSLGEPGTSTPGLPLHVRRIDNYCVLETSRREQFVNGSLIPVRFENNLMLDALTVIMAGRCI